MIKKFYENSVSLLTAIRNTRAGRKGKRAYVFPASEENRQMHLFGEVEGKPEGVLSAGKETYMHSSYNPDK